MSRLTVRRHNLEYYRRRRKVCPFCGEKMAPESMSCMRCYKERLDKGEVGPRGRRERERLEWLKIVRSWEGN